MEDAKPVFIERTSQALELLNPYGDLGLMKSVSGFQFMVSQIYFLSSFHFKIFCTGLVHARYLTAVCGIARITHL